jgi:hypothetical protein
LSPGLEELKSINVLEDKVFRLAKSGALVLALVSILGSEGHSAAQTVAPHHGQVWGSVRTEDRSTNNIFDKRVTLVVRRYEPDKLGAVVAESKLKHGHYVADLGEAPAGKYVVQVDPGGGDYGVGQTIVDYPGPAGNVHQNFTLVLGSPAVAAKE